MCESNGANHRGYDRVGGEQWHRGHLGAAEGVATTVFLPLPIRARKADKGECRWMPIWLVIAKTSLAIRFREHRYRHHQSQM